MDYKGETTKADRNLDPADSVDDAMSRLWGQTGRHRRGPKPSITVETIVEAAFELADSEGLAAVTLTRVGQALNCTAMALYRHIDSKDELLTLLVDRVPAGAPSLPDDLDWRQALRTWTRAQIDGVLAHPWLLELPLASTPLGPNRARWIDQGFGAMVTLDLPASEKGQILSLLSQHVLAEARVQVEISDGARNPFADLARMLDRLANVEDLPHLFAMIADDTQGDTGDELGIDLILDGIEARLQRQSQSR